MAAVAVVRVNLALETAAAFTTTSALSTTPFQMGAAATLEAQVATRHLTGFPESLGAMAELSLLLTTAQEAWAVRAVREAAAADLAWAPLQGAEPMAGKRELQALGFKA